MRQRPLVSILTPSFNQGRWLGDALTSVARQTYGRIEHIVVDGGSTDASVSLLDSAESGPVDWSSGPDRGQSHALNIAFARSNGEFIGWVNSDDAYCDTRAVAWAVDAFEHHPAVDVVFGSALLVDADNRVRLLIRVSRFSRKRLEAVNFVVQPAVFVRRTAIERIGRFVDEDLQFVMDRDLWFRLIEHNAAFHRLDRIIAIDRWHGTRKVAQPKYQLEAAAYDTARGIRPSPWSRARAAWVRADARLGGLARIGQLSRIELPIPLVIPPLTIMARNQLAFRRAHLAALDRSTNPVLGDQKSRHRE